MNQKNINQHKKQPIKTTLIYVAVLAFVTVGYFGVVYLYNHSNLSTKTTTPTAPSSDKVVNSDAPDAAVEGTDETKVVASTLDSYTVAADMPRFLGIKSLNMKARIQEMGVNSQGAVQAPVNIYDSGWYTGSAKPGTQGAAFVDGHASGSTREGLFAYIDTLKSGDIVTVEQGDGTLFSYKVVNVETVSKDAVDMDKALAVYGGAKEGLNLMTCTGRWIANQETYDKRVIVYTERIS